MHITHSCLRAPLCALGGSFFFGCLGADCERQWLACLCANDKASVHVLSRHAAEVDPNTCHQRSKSAAQTKETADMVAAMQLFTRDPHILFLYPVFSACQHAPTFQFLCISSRLHWTGFFSRKCMHLSSHQLFAICTFAYAYKLPESQRMTMSVDQISPNATLQSATCVFRKPKWPKRWCGSN